MLSRCEGSQLLAPLGNWSLEHCGRLLGSHSWAATLLARLGTNELRVKQSGDSALPLFFCYDFLVCTPRVTTPKFDPECPTSTKIQICPTGWSIPHHQPAKRLAAGPPQFASVTRRSPQLPRCTYYAFVANHKPSYETMPMPTLTMSSFPTCKPKLNSPPVHDE